jgi:myosin heavy subunit
MEEVSKRMPRLAHLWQIGFTKVFLKEDTRAGLEELLNEALMHHILIIQAGARGCLARKYVHKRKVAK